MKQLEDLMETLKLAVFSASPTSARQDAMRSAELGQWLVAFVGALFFLLCILGLLMLCGPQMQLSTRNLLRHLGFVMLHITHYVTNLLTMFIVFIIHRTNYFYVLLFTHFIIGCTCIYSAFMRLDVHRWGLGQYCGGAYNILVIVIVMGLMQGMQLHMAHEDYLQRRELALDEDSAALAELRMPSTMPARFHSKALDGLFEGAVFAFVSMYTLLKSGWAESSLHPVNLEQEWYKPCLYIGGWCSFVSAGLALVEIDHRTSACVAHMLDRSGLDQARHLMFRASEFSMRLLTVLVLCTFSRPLTYWWFAYVIIAADYLAGVAMLIVMGGRDPRRQATILLGLPLFAVNIMQFVDTPGMSLQARRISAVVVPLRAAELVGVLLFCMINPSKIKVQGGEEEMGMVSFLVELHPEVALAWASSIIAYYWLLMTYAKRTKFGADLHSAVAYGEVDTLRRLLRNSELVLDISRFGPDGRNPLHLAARIGEVACMKLLIEEKANLQARTGNRQRHTALHLAAMNKGVESMRFLLRACSDDPATLNATNVDGDTALHIAAKHHNVEVLTELLRHPAVDCRIQNLQGVTPAAACAPRDRFDFDRDSPEFAIGNLLQRAEANIRPPPLPADIPSRSLSSRSHEAQLEAARVPSSSSSAAGFEMSNLNGNSRSSGSRNTEPSETQANHAQDAEEYNEFRQESSTLNNVPLVSVGPRAEESFLRSTRSRSTSHDGRDRPLAVTNCGLSSFMLSAGLRGVGNFFDAELDKSEEGSTSSCRVGLEDFAEIQLLGEGAFGKVVLVRQKETGELYALKTMDKAKFRAQKIASKAHSEQFILRTTRHPFIVQLHFAFQGSNFWALVMDYCPNGDLQGCLGKYGTPGLDLQDAARFSGEVLLALEHLHRIRVIFRDLKLENVVIDANYRCKVTDFGLAKKLYSASDARTRCGSYGYAAPEIMMNTGRYTYAVDLYSYGVMLYMLASGGEAKPSSRGSNSNQPQQRLPPKDHTKLHKKLRECEMDTALDWARPERCVLPLLKLLTSEVSADRTTATNIKFDDFFARNLDRSVDSLLEAQGEFPLPRCHREDPV